MNLLFDLDGTLTDPALGITRCIAFALEQMGLEPPAPSQLTWCIGPPLGDSFRTLLHSASEMDSAQTHAMSEASRAQASLQNAAKPSAASGGADGRSPSEQLVSDEAVAKAIALYRERFREVGMLENELIAGVPEVLAVLAASGHRLFVATSKPHVYARAILKHFDLATHFEAIHGAELDGTRSHKADLIAHVLEVERLAPAHTLMIGDRHHDIDGARANSLESIGVLWGYGSQEELEGAGCGDVAAKPSELPECIARLRTRDCDLKG